MTQALRIVIPPGGRSNCAMLSVELLAERKILETMERGEFGTR